MALQKLISLPVSLALFLSFVLWGCGDDDDGVKPGDTTGQIQGTVRDAATGEAIPQVEITTVPVSQSIVTEADGNFLIKDIIPTQYVVKAQKTGYASKTLTVQVVAGGIAKADFLLENQNTGGTNDSINILILDGIGDYGVVPDHPDFDLSSGSFTVEATVNPSVLQNSGWHWVVNHGTSNNNLDYLLGFENRQPVFSIRSRATVLESDEKLSPNTWYHLAGVVDKDAGVVLLYVNGTAVATSVLEGAGVSTDGDLFIGARESLGSGKGTEFFNGVIREVRIWNRARSVTELRQTMTTSLVGTENGLIGYWPLIDGGGGMLQDYSGNDRSGILAGNPLWARIANPWN